MNRRVKPTAKRSRLVPAILAIAIVAIGFATLMARLEFVEEGYRLSALRAELVKQQENGQRLGVKVAELSSSQRLHTLAAKYRLEPLRRGQMAVVP